MKFFWLLLTSVLCFTVTAEPLPLPPQAHIVVEGLGTVERVPDIIELDIDIRKTASALLMPKIKSIRLSKRPFKLQTSTG